MLEICSPKRKRSSRATSQALRSSCAFLMSLCNCSMIVRTLPDISFSPSSITSGSVMESDEAMPASLSQSSGQKPSPSEGFGNGSPWIEQWSSISMQMRCTASTSTLFPDSATLTESFQAAIVSSKAVSLLPVKPHWVCAVSGTPPKPLVMASVSNLEMTTSVASSCSKVGSTCAYFWSPLSRSTIFFCWLIRYSSAFFWMVPKSMFAIVWKSGASNRSNRRIKVPSQTAEPLRKCSRTASASPSPEVAVMATGWLAFAATNWSECAKPDVFVCASATRGCAISKSSFAERKTP
mmetsp:Transcript_128666/g.333586  ORF Transcript_128666/g.333586 Transcript_128666/m.333586 type:complete len:294 (+) Transcript_128666:1357-2238(+)